MKKAPNVDSIIGRLMLLRRIQPGEKMRVNADGSFTIDPAGYFQFVRRSILMAKASRDDTVKGLSELVQDVNQYSETLLDSKSLAVVELKAHINELELAAFNSKLQDLGGLKKALDLALPGLENLKETYRDTNIEINIELVIKNLKSTCILVDERLKKLEQRLPLVQIHDTNRARHKNYNYMVESSQGSNQTMQLPKRLPVSSVDSSSSSSSASQPVHVSAPRPHVVSVPIPIPQTTPKGLKD